MSLHMQPCHYLRYKLLINHRLTCSRWHLSAPRYSNTNNLRHCVHPLKSVCRMEQWIECSASRILFRSKLPAPRVQPAEVFPIVTRRQVQQQMVCSGIPRRIFLNLYTFRVRCTFVEIRVIIHKIMKVWVNKIFAFPVSTIDEFKFH